MPDETTTLRIAAAGDVHCHDGNRDHVRAAFAALEDVDLVLLAGDLTTHGEPEQAGILADACRSVEAPVVAVLGNHDWHVNRAGELTALLQEAGITVLDRGAWTCAVAGVEVGVVGAKGFVGGFPGSHLPDFGEPLEGDRPLPGAHRPAALRPDRRDARRRARGHLVDARHRPPRAPDRRARARHGPARPRSRR
jgi:3',5'-cyclic AMP phosphodiesterase CpdA